MKNSNDTIGNRNRDLPACSAVRQPTAPPRAPIMKVNRINEERVSMPIVICAVVPVHFPRIVCSKNVLIKRIQVYKRCYSQRRNIIERSKQNIIFV